MSRLDEIRATLAGRKLTFDETEYLISRVERLEKALSSLIREVEIGTVPVFKGSPNVNYARDALAEDPKGEE